MAITIPEFQWRSMTPAINNIKTAPRLLQDLVFKTRTPRSSENIDVDIVIGGRQVLPFVNSGSPGTIVDKLGREMRTVKAPRIRPKKQFTAEELLTERGAGATFYASGSTQASARRKRIGEDLADLKNRIDITTEFMCAGALTGGYTVTQDDLIFTIDYQMPSAHKPTLGGGVGWNEAGGDIMADIDAYALLIKNATGQTADIGLCGSAVVTALRNNVKVQALLDNRRNKAGEFRWDTSNDYIGNLNGIDLYKYGAQYTDVSGSDVDYIDSDKFILIATGARFSIEFGLILDLDAGRIQGEFFSKSWMKEDPSALWMLAESRPLPVPWQPEAVVYADVIV